MFTPTNIPLGDMFSLWELFQMCELSEVMCQKGYNKYVEIHNNAFLYDENAPKDFYNFTNLANIPYPLLEIKVIDKFPADIFQT